MTFDAQALELCEIRDMHFAYSDRDTMLYALSLGMGADPINAAELPFVYEGAGLRAVPTMAVVLASTGIIRRTGVDLSKVLHGEQRLTLHRPLPVSGELLATSRVAAVYDKGAGKGAVLLLETKARTLDDQADGGFGGPQGAGPEPHSIPARPPDTVERFATRPDAALLYRLNADRNPLHADPKAAARAGFERPILHGLATYGIACRAVLKAAYDYQVDAIRTFDARFSAPVYPGDELVIEIWKNGDHVAFRARVPARDTIVLNNGRCSIGAPQ
ncbi:MaoC/PaaZ C-terminal domain-containing protein [Tardiphaga sp. 367_B4_N1_1]|uniref:MaoC family dehydratase n=1 Tax=Tardiphaga sp. 367_B4_N1_1 TaxID=3240777 RepID=UPI003F1F7659